MIGTARCRAGTPGGVRGEEAQASPLSRLDPKCHLGRPLVGECDRAWAGSRPFAVWGIAGLRLSRILVYLYRRELELETAMNAGPGIEFAGSNQRNSLINQSADVAELADALDSKSGIRKDVWVRPPPSAPSQGRFLELCDRYDIMAALAKLS